MTQGIPGEFGQWMYEFDLGDGVKTPVYLESLKQVHAVRREMIFAFLDGTGFDYKAGSVLDIACNEGYFLFEMLKRGARRGIGIEGRRENLAKASPYLREVAGEVDELMRDHRLPFIFANRCGVSLACQEICYALYLIM